MSSHHDSNNELSRYAGRAERMIRRWAGKQESKPRRESTLPPPERRSSPPLQGRSEHHLSAQGSTELDHVVEPTRRVPVMDRCEVLVVGGGPAGLSAALAARRCGADVMLLERYGCFGGIITTVGMETLAWYRYEGTVESEGIGVEMERLAAQMGGTMKWPYNNSECLDADFFKVVADHLVREAGVRPLLHCYATEAIVEEGRVRGVITESKSGRQAIRADRVIDCTGDADIAYLAGCSYRKTPRDQMLGVTTVFNCAGVDKERFLSYVAENPATYGDWNKDWEQVTSGKEDQLLTPFLDKAFEKAKAEGAIPSEMDISGTWSTISDAGEATNLNLVYMKNYDGTDVRDLTQAEMQGRQECMEALKALKAAVPGFENAKLRNFGMTIGTRDTRKIVGRYELTEDDVQNQGRFEDSIGIFPEFLDGYGVLMLPTTGRYFQVPYGALVPLEVDNLLVAGRCVAGDRMSHAAMRNMMACTVTGQGAGVAAAVSLAEETTSSAVDITSVQRALDAQGVRYT